MKKSRAISVMAVNLRIGDVLDGSRIKVIHEFRRRSRKSHPLKGDNVGILVVTPHPDGYDVMTEKFIGSERVTVRRPKSR